VADTLINLPPEVTADAANATQEIIRYITKRSPKPETDPEVRAAKWAALKVTLKKRQRPRAPQNSSNVKGG
jgi:hypothetical protein